MADMEVDTPVDTADTGAVVPAKKDKKRFEVKKVRPSRAFKRHRPTLRLPRHLMRLRWMMNSL